MPTLWFLLLMINFYLIYQVAKIKFGLGGKAGKPKEVVISELIEMRSETIKERKIQEKLEEEKRLAEEQAEKEAERAEKLRGFM